MADLAPAPHRAAQQAGGSDGPPSLASLGRAARSSPADRSAVRIQSGPLGPCRPDDARLALRIR